MNPRLKKLLIECHPDRHGGNPSRMSIFYRAQERLQAQEKQTGIRVCDFPGCRQRISAKNVACNVHAKRMLPRVLPNQYPGTNRLDDFVKWHILRVYYQCGQSKLLAARALGISRGTIYKKLRDWGLIKRGAAMAIGLIFLSLSNAPAATFSETPAVDPNPLTALQTYRQVQAVRAVIGPVAKTNGAIALTWNEAVAGETSISNVTTRTSYPAGTNTLMVLGGQPVGTNVYVALNQPTNGPALYSNFLTNAVAPDPHRLTLRPYISRADWPGAAGTVQTSSNLVHWVDFQPIAAGGSVLVTNDGAQKFYRVRLN